jgi:hypothetical protein
VLLKLRRLQIIKLKWVYWSDNYWRASSIEAPLKYMDSGGTWAENTDINRAIALIMWSLIRTGLAWITEPTFHNKCLLERGADPNTKDGVNGGTPLHRAVVLRRDVRRCDEDGIKSLLRFGAKIDLCDKEGNMVIEGAKELGDATALQILAEYNWTVAPEGAVVLSTKEIFGPWADLTSVSIHLDESLLVVIELFTIIFAALFVAVVTANCAQCITFCTRQIGEKLCEYNKCRRINVYLPVVLQNHVS